MKIAAPIALAVAIATLSAPAFAQFQKPEDAVKYRKAAFTVTAAHFSRIGAMANGRVPFDAKVAAENAALVETMSKLPWDAFGPGTDKGDTRAKPVMQARGEFHGLRHVALVIGASCALQFQIKTMRENGRQLQCNFGSARGVALHQSLTHRPSLGARQKNQAF